ncbi:MAG: 2-oxoacid:acceptor oxidoreductase family protein [Thermodesulfobacteriota bacterium]|nr:2-oxoacid:acceptor oxidoreductase family protein [Thermodesulfobacteriota bacterium]
MAEDMAMTTEIRFHGRGGQGAVTAAKFLAETALKEGKCFQAMPDYGGERMGAPVRAYTRISQTPIIPHCLVTEPDIVVVLDPTLLNSINVTEGIKKNGIVVVNTPLSPVEIRPKLGYTNGKVATVDATRIALHTLGRNIPNVPMLGALLKVTEVVDKKELLSIIKYKLGATMKASVVEANTKAFEQAYNECQIG